MPTNPDPAISFDLTDFIARVKWLRAATGEAYGAMSKRLFGSYRPLVKIMSDTPPHDQKTYPRLDTLLKAEARLTEWENELIAGRKRDDC